MTTVTNTMTPMPTHEKRLVMRVTRSVLALLLILIAVSGGIQAATGTITPSPFQLILDSAGNPVPGGNYRVFLKASTDQPLEGDVTLF